FNQSIQGEILKRSDGDLDAIDDLVEQAQEGAFDLRRCGGGARREGIWGIVQGRVGHSAFQKIVNSFAATLEEPDLSDECRREAARAFWKALATGNDVGEA